MRPAKIDVPGLLNSFGFKPDKRLGQNFLVDQAALERIIHAADIDRRDRVLEVGPGLGSLTRYLATAAEHVVTVELDFDLFPILKDVLQPYPNVQLIQGDILKLNVGELIGQAGYLVVANIPYNITSALIRHLLEDRIRPRRIVLTVQREVAERIVAGPGEMSLLSLGVQVYGKPRIASRIPAGSFYPAPKVDSAVIRIDLFPEPLFSQGQRDCLFWLARAGFSQKRKTLRNALAAGLSKEPEKMAALLVEAGIDPRRRAETLTLEEWGRLAVIYQDQT